MSEARRTGKRFPLTLPITIRTRKSSRPQSGTTANVSAAGVYIQSNSKLEIGASIEFDIVLPGKIVGTDKPVEIRCKGRVVRLEAKKPRARSKSKSAARKNKPSGIACVIDHYRFVRKK